MQTHIVPVGFDYDRLIALLTRDQLDVDRVILLEGAVGSEANVEYSRNLSGKLEKDFESLLGAETERVIVDNVYNYDTAFEQAYDLTNAELDADDELRGDDDEPGEVWVSVSVMPRPVSFAFATAAYFIMVEQQADRERIHTYYTTPEKYLETGLAEELRTERALLQDLLDFGEIDADRIRECLDATSDLLPEFDECGTTIDAKQIDGRHTVELLVASFSDVKPFEEVILFKLGKHGEFGSVSELAEALARKMNEECTGSLRSKVIYSVDHFGPGGKGYIEQEECGKSYRMRLSRIGELWVRVHADSDK